MEADTGLAFPSVRMAPGARVTAVLGPTNTGKTHLAIERMVGHQSGMIGLPLRLLAREVYDRVAGRVGPHAVALVTGEEKILPAHPRYWVSTVEAMPLDVPVEFLAIDEIQLAADAERGHVFTQRLLGARGQRETMLLGASTMRPLLEKLLPGANFITRPRFSRLSYSGPRKITRLPRRSAIVAFSADQVYAIAELVRRQRGGAAVVLGALSPRTRNAQVELYQNGDVDFIVATDAIGMGLNMDVDHVAFSAGRKFDGQRHRDITPAEMAQIAGRAGRHMNDGTFGVTGRCEPLGEEVVQQIEQHRFEPVAMLQWRSSDLDFRSVEALLKSLDAPPALRGLVRARPGTDIAVLESLARSDRLEPRPAGPAAVKTLWETCQIPDYRRIGITHHASLIARLYGYVMAGEGVVPEDWLARQLAYADRVDGDIDTLANRIAHVRTWTFVSNRSHWLKDAAHWQEKTRAIEDRLSDALHERLTQRFVDRRTSVLMKRLNENEALLAGVSDDGDVTVEGEFVGKLEGLRFSLDTSDTGADAKALRAAALKVLAGELSARARRLVGEDNVAFALTAGGYMTWRGAPVARLEGGDQPLQPRLKLLADEQLAAPDREAVETRLGTWLTWHLKTVLAPIYAVEADASVTGLARGVGFRIAENLGLVAREEVSGDVHLLDQPARATLRRHGLRFGAFTLFFPLLLKPQAAHLRLLLYKLHQEAGTGRLRDDWPDAPSDGLTSLHVGAEAPRGFYEALGYRLCGTRAVRADMLERLGDSIRPLVGWKPGKGGDRRPEGAHPSGGFMVTPQMMSLVGCSGEEFAEILKALGFVRQRLAAPTPETPAAAEASDPAAAAPSEPAAEAGASDPGPSPPILDDAGALLAHGMTAQADPGQPSPSQDAAATTATDAAGTASAATPVAAAPEPPAASDDTAPAASEAAEPEPAVPAATSPGAASPRPAVDGSADAAPSASAAEPTQAGTPSADNGDDDGLVDVWRPRGRRHERRGAPRRQHGETGDERQSSQAGDGDRPARQGRRRDKRRPPDHKSSESQPGTHPDSVGGQKSPRRNRRGGERVHHGQGASGQGAAGQAAAGQAATGKGPANKGRPPRKREPEISDDSPFAALKVLKEAMEKGKTGR